MLRGRIGKAAAKADDAGAAAATTTVLLMELRSRKRGPFADAAQAALNACAAVLRRGTDVQAHATAANAYEGAATEAFGSKKAKVPTKILKDCASKAPNIAAAAFLDKLPGWAENAPSPFLAGEALALWTAAGRASETRRGGVHRAAGLRADGASGSRPRGTGDHGRRQGAAGRGRPTSQPRPRRLPTTRPAVRAWRAVRSVAADDQADEEKEKRRKHADTIRPTLREHPCGTFFAAFWAGSASTADRNASSASAGVELDERAPRPQRSAPRRPRRRRAIARSAAARVADVQVAEGNRGC